LVNLTCGRNPWKQASTEDSTYKAFTKDREFLKTILPLSDELNDILGMIFEPNPEHRISIEQLKHRIGECLNFCAPSLPSPAQLPTPPQSPVASPIHEDVDSASDDDSVLSENCSLTGSCSTVSDGFECGSDSGCESPLEPAVDRQEFIAQSNKVSRPSAPFRPQYVLPSPREYSNPWGGIPVKNTWAHCGAAFECFEPFSHPFSGAYHSVYAAHAGLYTPPFQFAYGH
jgi:serine/threonine protein kinase